MLRKTARGTRAGALAAPRRQGTALIWINCGAVVFGDACG